MKRISIIFILFLALFLSSCATTNTMSLTKNDFTLTVGGKSYALQTPAATFVEAVTKEVGELSMVECDACMFDGKDREYSCDSIAFGTYPNGPSGSDMLESILVTGDAFKTSRGVSVGMKKADVVKAYGENYVEDYDEMFYYLGDRSTEPYIMFTIDIETGTVVSFLLFNNTTRNG